MLRPRRPRDYYGIAARLLPHVNLLLALYSGAALSTAARLQWDPSAYVLLRELFPTEYDVALCVLPALAIALAVTTHVALVALSTPINQRRRRLLLVYMSVMVLLACAEVVWGVWTLVRLRRWQRSPEARQIMRALDLNDRYLRPTLSFFGKWLTLPRKANELIGEAEEDVPRNVYAALCAGALLGLLQPLAAALALLAARAHPTHSACADRTDADGKHTNDANMKLYDNLPLAKV